MRHAEVLAARIEAAIRAEPDVGHLWRATASIIEAVASVGLEDVRCREADLLERMTSHSVTAGDPRGIDMASSILRVLRAPADILRNPVETVRRIERAAAPIAPGREDRQPLSDPEIIDLMRGAQRYMDTPISGAIRVSADYALMTQRHAPVAERLIFSAVEASIRVTAAHGSSRDEDEDAFAVTLSGARAGWIALPATALTRRGFRIWSPLAAQPLRDFLGVLAESLSWDLGQIGTLRQITSRLAAAGQGRRGRSRHADFAAWLPHRPVFSSAMIMDHLGVTRKTALSLIEDFESSGVLKVITPRRAARLWALSPLADRLVDRTKVSRQAAHAAAIPDETGTAAISMDDEPDVRITPSQSEEERMARAMEELDKALSGMDGLLAQQRGTQAGRGGA